MASGGERRLRGDVFCALDVSETGAAGVCWDRGHGLCAYYRRPLPRSTDHYDQDEAEISNLVAGVRYWEDDWEDEDLRVVLFSDLSHAEPLSPYRLVNLFGPEHLPQEFGNMTLGAGASSLRSELESLIHKTDITLQYVIDDPCSMSYYCVHHKDKKALNEGAALLSVANWLAHNVYADVEDIEDQIVEAVGDGRDLEIEVNKGTNVPENCLFDP